MRKRIVAILLIFMLLSASLMYPVTRTTTITISGGFDNIVGSVLQIDRWKKWFPPAEKAYKENKANVSIARDSLNKNFTISLPNKKYFIHVLTPMSYVVSDENGNWTDNFAFTLFPASKTSMMNITIVQKSPLFQWLWGSSGDGERAIDSLKSYLENPGKFYGFPIQTSQIRDTLIASKDLRTTTKELFHRIHETQIEVTEYIRQYGLKKSGPVSVSYNPLKGDSMRITVGIPVDRMAPAVDGISCLALPYKGKVLVGNYTGTFTGRQELYKAMSKYTVDHSLTAPGETFERYLDDLLPASDTSKIQIELNFPVY